MIGTWPWNKSPHCWRIIMSEKNDTTNDITRCMVRLDGVWITPDAALDEITRLRADLAALKERLVAVEQIARLAPELNLNNYDHDEVCELNDAMIQLYSIVRENEEQ